jgi:hypothetical protein
MLKTEWKASQVTGALRAAMAQLADMMPVYADVADYVVNVTRQRFVTGLAIIGLSKVSERSLRAGNVRSFSLDIGTTREPSRQL